MEMSVSIGIERAIADVHSAPSELNLETLKGKQAHFRAVLGDAKKILSQNLAGNAAAEVKAGSTGIVTAIDGLETASKNVFDFAASFAQPEAIAALSSTVAPAAAAVQAALKQFHEAAERANAAKAAVIEEMTTTITWITVALASFLVVSLAALAYIIVSRGIVRPISTINGVMTRLSGGDSSVAIPCADRFDEVGDIARAVQVFKDNAIRVLQMETEQKEQRIRTSEQRKADMIRLADGFESAVGEIVEACPRPRPNSRDPRPTLSATAERSQALTAMVAAASEEASTNVQSVASATEELSSSVNEISRQVQESARMATEPLARPAYQRPRQRALEGGEPHRRRRRTDQHHRGADQSARAQRHHRGGARRRSRPRLCGSRVRSQGAGRADRQGHRRDQPADLGHSGRDAGIGQRHQGNQRHHRTPVGNFIDYRGGGGRTRRRHPGNFPQRSAGRARHPAGRLPTSPTCNAAPARPARHPRRCCLPRRCCPETAAG